MKKNWTIYGIETWEDNPVDTCDFSSGYEWRYQKFADLQRHQSRSYRMIANRSSFNS